LYRAGLDFGSENKIDLSKYLRNLKGCNAANNALHLFYFFCRLSNNPFNFIRLFYNFFITGFITNAFSIFFALAPIFPFCIGSPKVVIRLNIF